MRKRRGIPRAPGWPDAGRSEEHDAEQHGNSEHEDRGRVSRKTKANPPWPGQRLNPLQKRVGCRLGLRTLRRGSSLGESDGALRGKIAPESQSSREYEDGNNGESGKQVVTPAGAG